MNRDLERCDREIASLEAELLAGGHDMEGLLQGLQDWEWERRVILAEIEERHENKRDHASGIREAIRCAA